MRVLGNLHRPLVVIAIAVALGCPASSGAGPSSTSQAGKATPADSKSKVLAFEVSCAANLPAAPAKGRVYVFLGPENSGVEPRLGPNWFRPEPFFAVDFDNWKPGEAVAD